jgi:hypothetical protein
MAITTNLSTGAAPIPLANAPSGAAFSIIFNAAAAALRRLRTPTRVQLDTITIDCTLNEQHAYDSIITEFEVEQGFNVTDHRVTKPVEFSITGIITETPDNIDTITESAEVAAGLLGNEAAIATQATFEALRFSGDPLAMLSSNAIITRTAFNKLLKLYTDGASAPPLDGSTPPGVFTIVTKYKVYNNMVVRSITFPRDRRTGDALQFTATFRELRVVQTKSGVFTIPQAQAPNPLGQMGGTPVTKPDPYTKSLLIQTLTGAGFEPGKVSSWEDYAKDHGVSLPPVGAAAPQAMLPGATKPGGLTAADLGIDMSGTNLGKYPMPAPPPPDYFKPNVVLSH